MKINEVSRHWWAVKLSLFHNKLFLLQHKIWLTTFCIALTLHTRGTMQCTTVNNCFVIL